MELSVWVRAVYLSEGKFTSIKKLHNGYESITILHFPEDLFIIDDHFSNFIDGLIDHSLLRFN